MTVAFDPRALRREFPIFDNDPGLVFLDSAASAQKPRAVIDRIADYYRTDYANVHRGVYRLSARSTELYEEARGKVQRFLNAIDPREIVFVRNTTEAINLVAQSWGQAFLREGDEVVLSVLEHHSNIVPWQLLRDRIGIRIRVAPQDATGGLDLAAFEGLLSARTKLVAVTHVANSTGTCVPVETVVRLAHRAGAKVLIDGSQAAPRLPVDVQALDCDFYAFTGHKLYGPSGIGVLYGKYAHLAAMPPFNGGGEMIREVFEDRIDYGEPPHKFEAGTPSIVQAIGLGAAIDYVNSIGRTAIRAHERALLGYATDRLREINALRIFGTAADKGAIISFDMKGAHPHDIATVVDRAGVAVRAGTHCVMTLLARFGTTATCRASFALYNTMEEIDGLAAALIKAQDFFA
jgi:cysteine desulfurase / selenocysteine lyase